MMAKQIKNVLKTLVCSILILSFSGCGLTLGPVVKTRYVIVKSGLPIEVLENRKVICRIIKDEKGDPVVQDIGGWIMMHPDHWKSLKAEVKRMKKELGEK